MFSQCFLMSVTLPATRLMPLRRAAGLANFVLKRTGRDDGLVAHLYKPGPEDDMMTPLRHAKVLAMNRRGMSIEGYVTVAERNTQKSKTHTVAVRWIVKNVGAPAVLDTVKLKARSMRRLAGVMASGFDPADDNRVD